MPKYRTIEDDYLRPGHVNLGRMSDKIVLRAVEVIPSSATLLPPRWDYYNQRQFQDAYGRGRFHWARTASYHLLLINGIHAFRSWTDTTHSCLVDVADATVPGLEGTFEILDIPPSTRRKTRPFTKRVRVTTLRQMDILVMQTMLAFGAL